MFDTPIKYCIGPSGDVLRVVFGKAHGDAIGTKRKYDEYVRVIHFPGKDVLYIRFPGNSDDTDQDDAFTRADSAVTHLIMAKVITRRTKVLYWQTGRGVTDYDICS